MIVGFNKLRRLDIRAQEALGGIDVQLTRRADLIPNLVATVKGYASHESGVLEEVTAARAAVTAAAKSGSVADRASAEAALDKSLVNVLAVAEAYPDLKASANFVALQQELGRDRGPARVRAAVLQRRGRLAEHRGGDLPVDALLGHGRGAQAGLLRGAGYPPGAPAGGVLRLGREVGRGAALIGAAAVSPRRSPRRGC